MGDKLKPWHRPHRRTHKPKLKKNERHKFHWIKKINEEPPIPADDPVIDENPDLQ